MMTKYYAVYPHWEFDLDYCRDLVRFVDHVAQSYSRTKGEWVDDPEGYKLYTGDPPCDPITEEQANYVIERIKSGEAEALAYKTWRKQKELGYYK